MDIAHIPPRVAAVIRQTAREHGISVESLLSRSRKPHIDAARREAMWQARALYWSHMGRTRPSYHMIGRWFGRDHASIISAVNRFSQDVFLHPDDLPVNEPRKALASPPKRESMAA